MKAISSVLLEKRVKQMIEKSNLQNNAKQPNTAHKWHTTYPKYKILYNSKYLIIALTLNKIESKQNRIESVRIGNFGYPFPSLP